MMRNTIKARSEEGYIVTKVRNIHTNDEGLKVCDGEQFLFIGRERTYTDYLDEKDQNEMFSFCEVFTTRKGTQFIYWRDEEIDQDYLTRVVA